MSKRMVFKFKPGTRVIVYKSTADTHVGVTGVIKRRAVGFSTPHYVVRRDDGRGWVDEVDHEPSCWNIPQRDLKIDKDYEEFGMDA